MRLVFFLLIALLLLPVEGRLLRRTAVEKPDAFASLVAWLKANGATLEGGVEMATTYHGGAAIRGMVSEGGLTANETAISIPEKLWLVLDNFPAVQSANLTRLGAVCERLDPEALELLQSVTAVALETKKGDASFYAPFIRTLPSMADFQSFHPMLGHPSVLAEFEALPAIQKVIGLLGYDSLIEQCFEAWRGDPSFPGPRQGASAIEWSPDMELALVQFRTRSYADGQKSAMVPLSDLGNTAPARFVNAHWSFENGRFFLRSSQPVAAMGEVMENYCDTCDNDYMLFAWGIYLQNNPNRVGHPESLDCMASIPGDAGSAHRTLQEATMSVLDMGAASLAELAEQDLTAPQCQPIHVPDGQDSLRCNLARLAWEYCARDWRRHDAETQDSSGATTPADSKHVVPNATLVLPLLGRQLPPTEPRSF